MERDVKLRRDGKSQTVTIPPEFALPGEDAIMRKEGDRIVIKAKKAAKSKKDSVIEWLKAQQPIDEEFPYIPDPPIEPEDIF